MRERAFLQHTAFLKFLIFCVISKKFEVMKLAVTRYDETSYIHLYLILDMEKPKILINYFW